MATGLGQALAVPSVPGDTTTWDGYVNWAKRFLSQLGDPLTADNESAIVSWELAEGGQVKNNARWNPLNTTLKTSGSVGSINSVGVQAYANYDAGLAATLQTINAGYYTQIRSALKAGNNARAVTDAVAASPWGTHGGATADLSQGIAIVNGQATDRSVGSGTGGASNYNALASSQATATALPVAGAAADAVPVYFGQGTVEGIIKDFPGAGEAKAATDGITQISQEVGWLASHSFELVARGLEIVWGTVLLVAGGAMVVVVLGKSQAPQDVQDIADKSAGYVKAGRRGQRSEDARRETFHAKAKRKAERDAGKLAKLAAEAPK